MADERFSVAQQGDVFRVVRNGEPQPDIDQGGFRARQEALDAAAAANLEIQRNARDMGIGDTRKGRMDATIKAMGG